MAIKGAWAEALKGEFSKPYYAELYKTVLQEYRTREVFPPSTDIFNAFQFTPLEEVKAVILGQDPYHERGQANGLCFSVKPGVRIPPSLVNIYQEMRDDLGCDPPENGDLTHWARQGVLLLNTVLTVRAHEANSHKGIGWETFTDAAIRVLAELDRPLVFILWGSQARRKKEMITNPKHLIIESAHPSPLSAYNGFFGSRPFSRCNDYLVSCGIAPIRWEK
jgi:uracil-DNA glycosylase